MTGSTSRRAAAFALAEDLLADIELSRIPPMDVARKASRLVSRDFGALESEDGCALSGKVIYAAVRASGSNRIFGLVLLTERRNGLLFTKPISEDMGPAEDDCPARILDLLTAPSNENARNWRYRCRVRLGLRPSGQDQD